MSNKCPYCKQTLKKIPKRTAKCKLCGKKIYVVKSPYTDKKELLSDKKAKNYQLINKFISSFSTYGITIKDINNTERELTKKFKTKPYVSDIVWSLCHKLLNQSTSDLGAMSNIYGFMSGILYDEKKPHYEMQKRAFIYNLKYMKTLDCKKIKIECSVSPCKYCSQDQNKIYDIDDEIINPHLPHKNCCCENLPNYCCCGYIAIY